LSGARGARVAVYYAPDPSDPLWTAGCAWLGRDPETGAAVPQPDVPGIDEATAEPRRYGFHCTLKAPIRLGTSYQALLADAEALAATIKPFDMPSLAVRELSGFLAVRETAPSPELQALADASVAWLDRHRLPLDAAERERRRAHQLSPASAALLERWGYPGVFSQWRFHMTLTRRLSAEEHTRFRPEAERFLAEALAGPRRVDSLCLFTQAAADAPFLIGDRIPFGA